MHEPVGVGMNAGRLVAVDFSSQLRLFDFILSAAGNDDRLLDISIQR